MSFGKIGVASSHCWHIAGLKSSKIIYFLNINDVGLSTISGVQQSQKACEPVVFYVLLRS